MIKLLSLFLLISLNANSFVHTKTEYNRPLTWNNNGTVLIYTNPTTLGNTTSSLSTSQARAIFNESIAEWNSHGPINITTFETTSLENPGVDNSIRFSSDPSYFGSGVLAVTSVNHSASTGEIYSADILINDTQSVSLNYSSDKSDTGSFSAYLGDVITHELGHFFGLGHSDVVGSSMIYSVFREQHTLHSDDVAGVNNLYNKVTNSGAISGQVVGGESIAVFGAQVQAISVKNGTVVSGVLSDTSGNFEINNLDTDDSYLIYVLPPRNIENLPTFYASIQSRYCSGRNYVPSFFTKCGGIERGKPQAINLSNSSSIDLGLVSIKCDEGLRADYLYEKTKEAREEVVIQESAIDRNLSESFVGYFSSEEIADTTSNSSDKLRIDLTSFSLPTSDNYYLEVKVITKEIGSGVKLSGTLESEVSSSFQQYTYGLLNEFKPDLIYQLPLSTNQNYNSFLLTLRADAATGFELNTIFANSTQMVNENSTYLLITSIKKYTASSGYTYVSIKDSAPYEDNASCLQGDITYTSKANIIGVNADDSSHSFNNDGDAQALSCGTIDINDNDGPGGMMSFIVGMSFIMLVSLFRRKSNDFFV